MEDKVTKNSIKNCHGRHASAFYITDAEKVELLKYLGRLRQEEKDRKSACHIKGKKEDERDYHCINIYDFGSDFTYYQCRSKRWLKYNNNYKSGIKFGTYVREVLKAQLNKENKKLPIGEKMTAQQRKDKVDSLARWYEETLKEAYKKILYEGYLNESEIEKMEFVLEEQFLAGWIYLVQATQTDDELKSLLGKYVRKRKGDIDSVILDEIFLLKRRLIILNNLSHIEIGKNFRALTSVTPTPHYQKICEETIAKNTDVLEAYISSLRKYMQDYRTMVSDRLSQLQNNVRQYMENKLYSEEESIEAHYYYAYILLKKLEDEFDMAVSAIKDQYVE